jgi:short-chain 2-methylacyl-CoA dehydrogenase
MNIYLNDKHHKIRQKVKEFAEKEIHPAIRELDDKEEFSIELVKKMGSLGLFGMHVPEQYGGKDADYLSYIIAVEELALVDSSFAATLAAHNSLGVGPILEFGTEKQKQQYLPRLCDGNHLWAFGLTEKNAGSDSRGVETTANPENGQWHINGSKMFITNGSSSMTAGITIEAITGMDGDNKEISTILVESGLEGYTANKLHGKLMWRAADNAEIFFKNVKVPKENLLGELGQGSKIMLKTIDSGRLSIAAIGLGLARGAFEMARDYAKKRTQFGKPIAHFQVNAFKLADMAMKIENARNTLYRACWLKNNGHPFGTESAMAKLYSSEIAREIADEAVQIFGGYGLFKDYHIERFYRDQRLLQIGEGTSEILRLVISRDILK